MRRHRKRGVAERVLRVLLWLAALGVLFYAALVGLVCYWENTVPAAADYDGIIVLGAQVKPDGEPSVQLRWRLDKAKEAYWAHPCLIVVCGAKGGSEPAPEGDVMRACLIAEGLPEADVISDPFSDDTQSNIENGWTILKAEGRTKPLIITSDYHLPRAMAIARDQGVEPQGAGSSCRPEFEYWLKNHCREALAWVKYWGIKYLKLPL